MMESIEFRNLYDAYYPDVLRFVHSLVYHCTDDAEVDEIVQNVFVKVAINAHQFRGHSQMKTWLFAIARNTVHDHVRQVKRYARRRGPSLSEWSPEQDQFELTAVAANRLDSAIGQNPFADPEFAAISAEKRAQVRACIDQLPLAMKTVIICRLLSDLTIAETAEVMNWSPARVRVTYSRALRKFRIVWEERE